MTQHYCLEPLHKRRLNRLRDDRFSDNPPLCGRLDGHGGQHLSQEVVARKRQQVRDWELRQAQLRQAQSETALWRAVREAISMGTPAGTAASDGYSFQAGYGFSSAQ